MGHLKVCKSNCIFFLVIWTKRNPQKSKKLRFDIKWGSEGVFLCFDSAKRGSCIIGRVQTRNPNLPGLDSVKHLIYSLVLIFSHPYGQKKLKSIYNVLHGLRNFKTQSQMFVCTWISVNCRFWLWFWSLWSPFKSIFL